MQPLRVAIVGLGKVARDQHISSIALTPGIELAAIATPIAARLALQDATDLPVTMELDWLQTGPQSWDIRIETDGGMVTLEGGGKRLVHEGRVLVDEPPAEYTGVYRRFVELAATGAVDMDLAPLALVADAFLLGERRMVAAFHE